MVSGVNVVLIEITQDSIFVKFATFGVKDILLSMVRPVRILSLHKQLILIKFHPSTENSSLQIIHKVVRIVYLLCKSHWKAITRHFHFLQG